MVFKKKKLKQYILTIMLKMALGFQFTPKEMAVQNQNIRETF